MSNADDAPVHQLVGFLAEFAPSQLAQLQRRYPGDVALRPGRTLGALSMPLRVRLEVAATALQPMAMQADQLSQRLGLRLRRSHYCEFVAQLVALIGSGGVLAAMLGDADYRLKFASALLGLLGSAVALAVKFMRRDLSGVDNGLVAQHRELISGGGIAFELSAKLEPYLRSGDDLGDPASLAALIDQANTLAGQLYTLIKQTGSAVVPLAIEPKTPPPGSSAP